MFSLKRMEKVIFIKVRNVQFKAHRKSNVYKIKKCSV